MCKIDGNLEERLENIGADESIGINVIYDDSPGALDKLKDYLISKGVSILSINEETLVVSVDMTPGQIRELDDLDYVAEIIGSTH
jgi:hypothetical protein